MFPEKENGHQKAMNAAKGTVAPMSAFFSSQSAISSKSTESTESVESMSSTSNCASKSGPSLAMNSKSDLENDHQTPTTANNKSDQDPYVKAATLRAEVIWALHATSSHFLYNSNQDLGPVLKHMFPNCQEAQSFSCKPNKMSYLCGYGLGPYFKEKLRKKVEGSDYVLLYDESLNKEMQEKQMDIHVRFWDNGFVKSQYFTSEFVGHSKATDLAADLKNAIDILGTAKLLQVSMDGPNVNLKTLQILQKHVQEQNSASNKLLLDIGTCGLHTCHNAFRAGMSATGWNIDQFLSAAYNLLKDAPARREDFIVEGKAKSFPLRFVKHR